MFRNVRRGLTGHQVLLFVLWAKALEKPVFSCCWATCRRVEESKRDYSVSHAAGV